VGKIAAGEVVEGPASVVKELVENSIDAGARRVQVTIVDGGRESITVMDDGCGIEPDDVLMAFQRHATSKIRDAADLQQVTTLGFRGEALPVVAAVSRVTMLTRPSTTAAGTEIRLEGGRVLATGRVGCAPGTVVTVADLFFNVPPRRKSLRSSRAEAARTAEVMSALMLARPDIAFRLRSADRELLASPGTGRRLDALVALVGLGDAARMLEVEWSREEISVVGFVGEPGLHGGTRSGLFTVVNGRPVRDRVVAAAVEDVYRTLLPAGRHPVGVLWLELPRICIDVNVHPAKLTVAHRDPQLVRQAVTAAVVDALGRAPIARRLWSIPARPPESQSPPTPVQQEIWQVREQPAETAPLNLADFRVVGQVHRSYLVLEGPQGVYLVDQHAAHERVTYERLAPKSDPGAGTQLLLVPLVLELKPKERARWEELAVLLEQAGFVAEPFGGNAVLVRGVPAAVSDVAGESWLRAALEKLGEEERADDEGLRRALAACRASVKARTELGREEMEALWRDLAACRHPYACAHGRPTLLKVGLDELERRFGRT